MSVSPAPVADAAASAATVPRTASRRRRSAVVAPATVSVPQAVAAAPAASAPAAAEVPKKSRRVDSVPKAAATVDLTGPLTQDSQGRWRQCGRFVKAPASAPAA